MISVKNHSQFWSLYLEDFSVGCVPVLQFAVVYSQLSIFYASTNRLVTQYFSIVLAFEQLTSRSTDILLLSRLNW